MYKAPARDVDDDALYEGMITAYQYSNIGVVSNKITKIWNSDNPDLDAIKQLCCLNNFTIDAAKTLFLPEPPEEIGEKFNELTSMKVPHFFIYAKGKTDEQVMPVGNGCVDRLEHIIKDTKFNFQKRQLGEFNYRYMMTDPNREITEQDMELVKTYIDLASRAHGRLVDDDTSENYELIFCEIRQKLEAMQPDIERLVDVLVKYNFYVKKSKRKVTLWSCFGKEIYENLERNLPANTFLCDVCGKREERTSPRQTHCSACAKKLEKEKYKRYNNHRLEKVCKHALE